MVNENVDGDGLYGGGPSALLVPLKCTCCKCNPLLVHATGNPVLVCATCDCTATWRK